MRHLPVSAALVAGLLVFLVTASGCSRRAERLVGNELLKRRGGLGTTVDSVVVLDRDTYVVPARTANLGPTLLVGRTSGFEAQTLLQVSKWSLPDTTLPGFAVDAVELVLPYDDIFEVPTSDFLATLSLASAAWTESTAAWQDPGPGPTLGAAAVGDVPYVVRLPSETFVSIKAWARDPASLNGFVLHYTSGVNGLAGFAAGQGFFRIIYSHPANANGDPDTVITKITEDLYVHSPATQLATGSDTTLVAGGLLDYRIAFRFATPEAPAGASINRAVVRLTVRGTADTMQIDLYKITATWPETATGQEADEHATAVLRSIQVVPFEGRADTPIEFTLPEALVREWQTNPSANEGLLLTVRRADVHPPLEVSAREGSAGGVLFVTTTTPPPGRF